MQDEPKKSDLRARALLESLKFKEERDQIALMSEQDYRAMLEEKLGTSKWAQKEIELLLRAKRDQEQFTREFEQNNHIKPVDPIGKDFRTFILENKAKEEDENT